MKGQGLVAPDQLGSFFFALAGQLDPKCCFMNSREIDLGVLAALPRPTGESGYPQLHNTKEERDMQIKAHVEEV